MNLSQTTWNNILVLKEQKLNKEQNISDLEQIMNLSWAN
jgi:hypothetical protein